MNRHTFVLESKMYNDLYHHTLLDLVFAAEPHAASTEIRNYPFIPDKFHGIQWFHDAFLQFL